MINRSCRVVPLLIVGLLLVESPTDSTPGARVSSQSPPIRVDVDLTLVNTTVTDRNGRTISGLTAENFQLWEDNVEQRIESFTAEDIPTTIGLVVDMSSSMDRKSPLAREAVSTFLRTGNRDDEYFLVEFNSRPRLVEDFTENTDPLEEFVFSTRPNGSTALFDAVYFAIEKMRNAHRSKKALLLISDGQDNISRYRFTEITQYIKEQDAQIYAIGTFVRPMVDMMHRSPADALIGLTGTTGGQVFFPRSTRELPSICKRIAEELRNQYVIGYRSTNRAADGKWRKIRVKVNLPQTASHATVRAKTGYYAPRVMHSERLVKLTHAR